MSLPIIAVIGTGNMGNCLIHGLLQHGHPIDKLWASDPNEEKLAYLQQTFFIHTTPENASAVAAADVVIFAVKPQIFATVAKELAPIIQAHQPLIISIAAGVRVANIQKWLGDNNLAIVRTMPNTPALIGCSATALYANAHVTDAQRNQAESILRTVGLTIWLEDEAMLDAVTALSGNGPAYFFLVMEALQETAEQLGLSRDVARLLTLQTALGAAKMAFESGKPLDELRKIVTSPGGTTEKAIFVLEENNIRGIFKDALTAAKLRSEELGNHKDHK